MVSELIDIVVDLYDVLLLLLDQALQLLQIVLVHVAKTVRLELLHGLISQPIHYLVYLLPLRRIVREFLPENLLVLL